MKTFGLFLRGSLLLIVALAVAAGCSTLQYRQVQSQFEDAVRADNERFGMPFTEPGSSYRAVAEQLTPDYIRQLDPKLRPNAWTLRSVSQWRAGDLAEAVASSLEGLAEINQLKQHAPQLENSRDNIILTMLPGLVEDSRLRKRFLEMGSADVAEHYNNDYAGKFKTSIRALAEARVKKGPATPPEVNHYWALQCWRVLANWSYVIGTLPNRDARISANTEADSFIRTALAEAGLADVSDLPKALTSAETLLPNEHPYRQLIALERQQ
jgi:hypothetical protein